MKKIAIITTHPVQYNAPLFQLLALEPGLTLKVFYTWGQSKECVFDHGFGKVVSWDLPLTEGYSFYFVKNISKKPGSNHFKGIRNPSLISDITEFNPNIILVFGWSFYSHLKVMRYFKGKKEVWFRGDSNLLDEDSHISLKKIARRLILKWVYSFVDKALYVGNANFLYYKKHGLKNTQLAFAPHAVDNLRFKKDSISKENDAKKWRLELGISKNSIVFLFVGKLEKKKSPALLIQAFKKLNDNFAYLIFVGDGEEASFLKELSVENNRIIFLGFQNQSIMPIAYRVGDILVLPSRGPGETWGLAVNESFACARPAIVSEKVGCAQDLIIEGQTGWTFNSTQEVDLMLKMKLAIAEGNSGLRKMGDKAHTLIQSWNFETIINSIKAEINADK